LPNYEGTAANEVEAAELLDEVFSTFMNALDGVENSIRTSVGPYNGSTEQIAYIRANADKKKVEWTYDFNNKSKEITDNDGKKVTVTTAGTETSTWESNQTYGTVYANYLSYLTDYDSQKGDWISNKTTTKDKTISTSTFAVTSGKYNVAGVVKVNKSNSKKDTTKQDSDNTNSWEIDDWDDYSWGTVCN